nr:J18 [uncultured bacterium]
MTTAAELHTMGVIEIAAEIAAKRLSPVDLTAELIRRISAYDGAIRAWSFMERESVMLEAQAMADEALEGKLRGPLHGVPFAIKEQFALGGAPSLGDWTDPNPSISPEDATVVAKLKEAGALVIGKTYMTGPAGMPPTRNPWNLEYSPGGSSSGPGAAVGARFVPFALSEQTAGSGIRPAAYNGVAGLKPTFGRNSRFGMFTLSYSQDHPCIIATTLADVIPVFAVTAGHDPKDVTSRLDGAWKGEVTLTKPPKIGVVRNFFTDMTEPEMQACIDAAAEKLAASGAEVVDYYFPDDFGVVWANASITSASSGAVSRARKVAKAGGKESKIATTMTPVTKFTNYPRGVGELIPAAYYVQAQRVRRYLRDLVDKTLTDGGLDAILMATAPGAAPHDNSHSGDPTLCQPWSHLGQPAISIPGGIDSEGMPLGLQLVSQTMSDEKLLAIGVWCQEVLGLLPEPDLALTAAS